MCVPGVPSLSICIPTYNRSGDIFLLLESILMHGSAKLSSGHLEVIVSDNASDDDTQEVVEKFSRKSKNIKYFKNEANMGFAFNLNRVVRESGADYCWLLGSDEVILSGAIEVILEELNRNPDVIVANPITHGKERKFLKEEDGRVILIKSDRDFESFLKKCTEISSAFAFISTLIVNKKFWNGSECTQLELSHPYTHMLRICRGIKAGNTEVLYINRPVVVTGQNLNEFNSNIFRHFRLDLLTIKYVSEVIFCGNPEIFSAYGGVFVSQYGSVNAIKARIECPPGEWGELKPVLTGFGYGAWVVDEKRYDNLLLLVYETIKKIKSHVRNFLKNLQAYGR